jgi:pilus assembly protein CpaC
VWRRAHRLAVIAALATGTWCAAALAAGPVPVSPPATPAAHAPSASSAPAPAGAAALMAQASPQSASAGVRPLQMFVGQSKVLTTPDVARVAVGNGQVLKAVALDGHSVLLFADAAGDSSLLIWTARGQLESVDVVVHAHDIDRLAHQISEFVGHIPGVKTSIIGGQVVIQGSRLSNRDLQKISIIAKRYPKEVINFTDPMSWEKMVLIHVTMVEIPRTVVRNLGIQWNTLGGGVIAGLWAPMQRITQAGNQVSIPVAGGGSLPIIGAGGGAASMPGALNVMSLFNLGLGAQLNALEQKGEATILAQPELSTRNGAKASFFAGGKIPYTVSALSGSTTQFENYGIKLTVLPVVDPENDIDAKIEVDDSSIDTSASYAAGPALLDRTMNTEFNVHSGQTIVLSGLMQRSLSRTTQKVPGLGDLPLVGALFRSHSLQDQRNEMVVFVTPVVVSAGSSREKALLDQARSTIHHGLRHHADPLMPGPILPALDLAGS